ncbi:WD40-repeat-containing domain protein [Umbelopsis sp. PMI_123]|nr:WD40-repeat-containing domain protein [Umbelopsis sp. PMI_123]
MAFYSLSLTLQFAVSQWTEVCPLFTLPQFRGFNSTFRALELESRADRDKGFQVDKIIEELFGYVQTSDITNLMEFWRYLDTRYFSRLDSRFQRTVKKFELCLLRYYLVHAMQVKRRDKVIEFFDVYGAELHENSEWLKWFALPYSKNPTADPAFETFFSKQWLDNYIVSLHNFLNTIFQNMPLPSLLTFNLDKIQRKAQQTEIDALKASVESLKANLETLEGENLSLKQKLTETKKEMTDGMTRMRRRAVSMVDSKTRSSLASSDSSSKTDSRNRRKTTQSLSLSIPEDDGISEPSTSDSLSDSNEAFLITTQEEFFEHTSGITHAKFSGNGTTIASCDMDNIIRTWSYQDQLSNPSKIKNAANVLSLEWEARSDKLLLIGTDSGLIRVYNTESQSIVQTFRTEEKLPKVTQISCSPSESVFVSAASNATYGMSGASVGSLISWNLKTMQMQQSFDLEGSEASSVINTVQYNHNGQLLVSGTDQGFIRIFDARTIKPIMEWKAENPVATCFAQFSFDETSIMDVSATGMFTQWSVHKPGVSISSVKLTGFPPPSPFSLPASTTPQSPIDIPGASLPIIDIPKPRVSSSSASRKSVSSMRSGRLPSVDDTVTQTLLSVSPRPQMVAFSHDTEHLLCAATATEQPDSPVVGTVYQVATGEPAQQIAASQNEKLTVVDWTSAANACLTGTADGSIRVTKLIRV